MGRPKGRILTDDTKGNSQSRSARLMKLKKKIKKNKKNPVYTYNNIYIYAYSYKFTQANKFCSKGEITIHYPSVRKVYAES
jgi:hypothetical protein